MQVILNKVPSIFSSKRFWVYFINGIVMVAVFLSPDLEAHAVQINASLLAGTLFLIKGYSDQDTASAAQGVNKYNQTTS